MLALLYLLVMCLLGDAICRRFFSYASGAHRLAAAFLSGLLISSWATYLAALLFSFTSYPMLLGNLLFFAAAILAIVWLRRMPPNAVLLAETDRSATKFEKWDWIVLGVFFVVAWWMMFGTFDFTDGKIRIAHHQWSDFGSTVSIMQSFALGDNFPTEYPHFTGERIRYHFLYYFQAGNLEYLGLNPALSNNILSVFSMLSMLILVMTLGVVAFGSRVVGRIGALLFFFHGSLSFIPYLYTQGADALTAVLEMRGFLPSGYDYRGELWGVWSQVVFLNQRHFASSIGIFLLVLTFLFMRYRLVPESARRMRKLTRKQARNIQLEHDAVANAQASALEDESAAPEQERDEQLESYDLPNGRASELESPEGADISRSGESDIADAGQEENAAVEPESDMVIAPSGPIAGLANQDETVAPEQGRDDRLESYALANAQASALEDESGATDAEDIEAAGDDDLPESNTNEPVKDIPEPRQTAREWFAEGLVGVKPFIFSGILLGLLPMWNGAVFAAAFAVLTVLFLLFPLRRQMIGLALTTALFALPQVYYLKTGGMADPGFSLIDWGYTLIDPTVMQVIEYLGFIFGFKWLLIAIALIIGTWLQQRLMIAITSLIALTFFFQFSAEALTNHKFLNIWLIIANLYVAAAIWFLWNLRVLRTVILGRIAAVVLTLLITLGGVIDIFPIRNSTWMEMGYRDDILVNWIRENTPPDSIFLSHRYVNHFILMAGRRLFYGHPYYAWGAGYPTYQRDLVYRQMFESRKPEEVFKLLKDNNISYVAIDKMVRAGDFIKRHNESIYKAYFETVFEDIENRYDNLVIYKVPDELGPPNPNVTPEPTPVTSVAATGAFQGGEGQTAGQFSRPRGIATSASGHFFVADTGNGRIQKFDSDGKYVSEFVGTGAPEATLKEPNGVAVDSAGMIYVVDASHHKLMKFRADGTFEQEWKGPDPGFYGPRDIAIGPNRQLYILDQGRTRIVRFDPATEAFTEWGTSGPGEGQFNEATGLTVGGGFVFVADAGNNRMQVFDLDGKFIRQWEVPVWNRHAYHYPDVVFDDKLKRLYVTSGVSKEVLAFDIDGNPIADFKLPGTETLDNPSSLAIIEGKKGRQLLVVNTFGAKVSAFDLETPKAK